MTETITRPTDPAWPADDGYAFDLTGGHAALDFANTSSRRENPAENRDYLTHYGRLVSWSVQSGVLTAKEGERLRAEARAHPRAAAAALRRAIAIREPLFALFLATARNERPPADALEAVNAALPGALAALRVSPAREGFTLRFAHDETELAPMLAPVLRAAAELLTCEDLPRVRECDSDTCFWLFLDRSKNGTRRWCDMRVCGNRAKARRHYHKEKKAARPRRRSRPASEV